MNDKKYINVKHPFEPVYDGNSKVLILGSFPSVKSRENDFYYGNNQNRFWKVVSSVTGEKEPFSIREKKDLLIRNNIAVYDVISSCDILKSYDSSIKNVKINDIEFILKNSQINKIYTNGNKAHELYQKYLKNRLMIDDIKLPSTSPANAKYNMDMLIDSWRLIKDRR